MNTKTKNGVALVIVIVLILLFSAIILSVVLTSTTAYRRSVYFRDRNIAFNLAQIGIADALYKLNYRYHDPGHYYGFRPDGECLLLSDGAPKNGDIFTYTLKATEIGFPLASINDGVTVQLIINDGTYPDTLLAIGKYRGRTAKLSAGIRTLSDENTNLQRPLADSADWDTKGVPEAFNKHVIYAGSVSGTGTTVKGNIATSSPKPDPWPATWTDATWIQTSISLPKPIVPYVPFETNPDYPPSPDWNGWIEFQMRGQPRYRIDGGSWNLITGYPGGGVSYSADGTNTETFTFTGTFNPQGRKIYVRASFSPSGRSGGACFDGSSGNINIVNSVLADGNIVFKGNVNLSQNAIFEADVNNDGVGTLIIHPNTTFSGSDLIVYDYNGNGSFVINQANITINGALITNCSMTIGANANNFRIDATTSTKNAAIILYSPQTTTFTLSSTPDITLGNSQHYAFLLLAQNVDPLAVKQLTVNIGTSGNVDFFTRPIINLGNKATFVAYSTAIPPSIPHAINLNIGSGSYYAKIPGLIFSYGNPGNITLNNANTYINGCLVANGTVTLNSGTLVYDKNALSADRVNIYSGFAGGRRIYLPMNWKLQW
ncbi:MAG: hypothetical protein NC913_06025 [Candidatus Omnitrophica bacterium]|nr:hypothetical protein [Candidatus Omnitrophota bacterium]